MWVHGRDWAVPGQRQLAEACECGNEHSGYAKCWKFVDYLQTSYLPKKHPAPCSKYVSNTSKVIFCVNGSRFRSPSWKRKLYVHEVEIRFSPVRHTQSNTRVRIINELSKFCCMYWHRNLRCLADLLQQIEQWLNQSVYSCTVYDTVEFIVNEQKPDIIATFLPQLRYSPINERLSSKVLKS